MHSLSERSLHRPVARVADARSVYRALGGHPSRRGEEQDGKHPEPAEDLAGSHWPASYHGELPANCGKLNIRGAPEGAAANRMRSGARGSSRCDHVGAARDPTRRAG